MSIAQVLKFSAVLRIFIVVAGIGLVFFRCLKSVEVVATLPMIEAVSLGQVDRVKELLHDGQTPNVVDKDGNSPLSFAMWNTFYKDNGEIIELLLDHRADVNSRNKAGQTPLMYTVKVDLKTLRMQTIGKLIKFGAKMSAVDNKGFDLLQKNIETYDTTTTGMILDWWGRFITPKMLRQARDRADEYELRDIMEVLDKGPKLIVNNAYWDPSAIDSRTGLSDLHCAVINDDKKLVETMIARIGFSKLVNQASKDEYGMRPLHYAVLHEHPDMLDYLIECQANVNKTNLKGNTPLHMVAWLKNKSVAKKIIDTLLKKNANLLGIKNNDGNTFLHLLIYDNDIDLINYISKNYTFNLAIKNNDLETPVQLAERLERKSLLRNVKNSNNKN